MAFSQRLLIGKPKYQRLQEPARYMTTGELRPCRVCKQVRNGERKLYGVTQTIEKYATAMVNGRWEILTEPGPDGDPIASVKKITHTVNYHRECEAEKEKASRKRRGTALARLGQVVEQLQEELRVLKHNGVGIPPRAPVVNHSGSGYNPFAGKPGGLAAPFSVLFEGRDGKMLESRDTFSEMARRLEAMETTRPTPSPSEQDSDKVRIPRDKGL